jgi:hypothetical protein
VAQAVEHLLCKYKALSSDPSPNIYIWVHRLLNPFIHKTVGHKDTMANQQLPTSAAGKSCQLRGIASPPPLPSTPIYPQDSLAPVPRILSTEVKLTSCLRQGQELHWQTSLLTISNSFLLFVFIML